MLPVSGATIAPISGALQSPPEEAAVVTVALHGCSHPLLSPCARGAAGWREDIWQGAGSRAGGGRLAAGEGERKEIHSWEAERVMVLFLFLTTGSCEVLRRIILGLGPGCFMLCRCLSFPSSYLNPSDIICNYFKKAEAQRERP